MGMLTSVVRRWRGFFSPPTSQFRKRPSFAHRRSCHVTNRPHVREVLILNKNFKNSVMYNKAAGFKCIFKLGMGRLLKGSDYRPSGRMSIWTSGARMAPWLVCPTLPRPWLPQTCCRFDSAGYSTFYYQVSSREWRGGTFCLLQRRALALPLMQQEPKGQPLGLS